MKLNKCIWGLRALLLKFRFGRIGRLCYMGKPVYLSGARNVFLGDRVRILPHFRLEVCDGGEVRINDNVSIAQNVHITSSRIALIVESGTVILANTYVTNIDHDYRDIAVPVLSQRMIISETKIGKNCFIGMGAAIQAGTILGDQCVVGSNSVVRGKFPDYSVIVGAPARIVKRYDKMNKCWRRTNPEGVFID